VKREAMSRRMRIWVGVGTLLGACLGGLPVGAAALIAQQSNAVVPAWALLLVWPASVMCGAGLGWSAAYLVERLKGSHGSHGERQVRRRKQDVERAEW
jgi:hypothetical protein